MDIEFGKEYLEELYTTGKCRNKKYRFQPEIVRSYVKRVLTLDSAPNVEALYTLKSLNYEVLTGDKDGVSSIRINDKYRLEFIVDNDSDKPTIIICTLLDISNHYKK